MSSENDIKLSELNELVKRTNVFKRYPQISILKEIQSTLEEEVNQKEQNECGKA